MGHCEVWWGCTSPCSIIIQRRKKHVWHLGCKHNIQNIPTCSGRDHQVSPRLIIILFLFRSHSVHPHSYGDFDCISYGCNYALTYPQNLIDECANTASPGKTDDRYLQKDCSYTNWKAIPWTRIDTKPFPFRKGKTNSGLHPSAFQISEMKLWGKEWLQLLLV
jgi:hypothetical protein